MEILCLCFYMLLFLVQYPTGFSLINDNNHHVCLENERQLLLQLKQELSPYNPQKYYRTKYWKGSRDCCLWDGVACDYFTGHVIALDLSYQHIDDGTDTTTILTGELKSDSSLFHLTHLRKLNLAFNDFGDSAIPSEFGRLNALTHLNLSGAEFGGEIPMEFYHLSNLLSLDLSAFIMYNNNFFIDAKMLLGNMTRLRVLVLTNLLSVTQLPMNMSSFLTHLDLSDTGLRGKLPATLFEKPNLQFLDLSGTNGLKGSLPMSLNWSNVHSLKILNLAYTSISGRLPDSIGFMTNLNYLDLSGCGFSGPIPESIGNITAITFIDLAFNDFSGRLPDSIGLMTNLNHLDLSHCRFWGPIPEFIGNITAITRLDLSFNHLEGPVPDAVWGFQTLTVLDLSYNYLQGRIPSTISNLRHLTSLYLSNNHLEGQLPDVFSGLQNLTILDLSYNYLEGQIPSSLTNMSRLEGMDISSNALTGPFPSRAGHGLQHLLSMDLSNNSIRGMIPTWLFTLPSLETLDLSSNKLTGRIGKLNFQTLEKLDLSSNLLSIELQSFYNLTKMESLRISNNLVTDHGSEIVNVTFRYLQSLEMSSCEIKEFPNFLRSNMPSLYSLDLSANFLTYMWYQQWQYLMYLDLSSNSLRGTFPSSICNISDFVIINLSNNKLSGNIPECLANSSYGLEVLDLRRNEFHGKIPTTIGAMYKLYNLGLNGNHLEGPMPRSLASCTYLEVIDLGNNMLQDTFPWWLHSLPELKILILKSNSFHGSIATPAFTNNSFTYLQILDLSYNSFTGLLPEKLFASLEAIKNQSQVSPNGGGLYMGFGSLYEYSVTLSVKGIDVELTKVLNIFNTIDLSSNNFNGSIPESISYLTSLRLLNLSHNSIHGGIPPALGRMTNLEQLDLSSNQLTGGIPQTLTNLTFLEVLDLSHNHLVGPIPKANQFLTFSNESYADNSGLCGLPLTRSCGNEKEPPSAGEDEEDDGYMMGFTWKTVVIGYGCGILLGFILGNILISIERPRWLARFVYVEAAIILHRRKKRRRRVVQGAR